MGDLAASDTQRGSAPAVSIVIPAFNAAATLERAVRSALDLTRSDREIIIVDDGSRDTTFAIAQSLALDHVDVRALKLAVNKGPSAARNAALSLARGDWVALLDADDAYEPTRLEHLLAIAEREGADFVADNIALRRADTGHISGVGYTHEKLQRLSPLTLTGLLDDAANPRGERNIGFVKPLMRAAFLQRHGLTYDEDVRTAEDWLLYGRALIAGAKFVFSPEPLYLYTLDPGSQSRSRARMVENLTQLLLAGERLEAHMRAASIDEPEAIELLEARARRVRRLRRVQKAKKLVLDQPALRAVVDTVKGRA